MNKENQNKLKENNKDRDDKPEVMFEIKTIKTGLKAARQGCCDGGGGGGACGGAF